MGFFRAARACWHIGAFFVIAALATNVDAAGVTAGNSSLFDTPDYTDTFTGTDDGGIPGRPYVAAGLPEYVIENNHGNPVTNFTLAGAFSIASDLGPGFVQGAGPAYPVSLGGNASGAGSDTGFTQTGGGGLAYGVEYGLRDEYVVQVDAVQVTDRVDITSGDAVDIFASNSISVFFRGDGSGNASVFNGATDTSIQGEAGFESFNTGIAAWNDVANGGESRWYNYAVRFDALSNEIEIFVNEVSLAVIDLNTFAGGIYSAGFSNQFVGVSSATGDRTWTDNFQVGGFAAPPVFCDDFERADGPLADGDWTVNADTWNVVSGGAVVGPTSTEAQAFAGNPAVNLPAAYTISFDWEFLAAGAAVGKHAGCFFEFSAVGGRGDAGTSGYQLHWIDRASDFGFNLVRYDGATPTGLQLGTGELFAAPPTNVRIEVAGDNIKIFGDDTLAIDVNDATHRGGHFGLWAWQGGNNVRYDNVCITEPEVVLSPCFEVAPDTVLLGDEITFDGSCSFSNQEIAAYRWDFGDGDVAEGQVVGHGYSAAGTYTVSLTVETASGATEALERELTVFGKTGTFCDDFERADGPVDGWTVTAGPTWGILGGELVVGPTAEEHWIWAGSPPAVAPSNATFEFDHTFLAPGTVPAIGRHGGFQFHATKPTVRSGGNAFSGYFIDWIDRASDLGPRLTRADNGAFVDLANTGLGNVMDPPAEPPLQWRVEVDGANIRVFGDGVLHIDVADATYRGGFYGFWTWTGDQEIAIDNFCLEGDNLTACFTTSDGPIAGEPVSFDGSCSSVFDGSTEVVSWDWDFGDGTTEAGAVVDHVYAAADNYTVTLVITDSSGATSEISQLVVVSERLPPFRDCFDRADGPPDGWTVNAGVWNIQDESLVAGPAAGGGQAGEQQAFAGEPPGRLPDSYTISFDWEFLAPADSQPVGRHAGCFFEFNQPGIRWDAATSGYQIWWIDRDSDRGLTLARWNAGGGFTTLNPPGGTGELFPDVPRNIQIDVDGPNIRVYGDGVLAIDVEDDTYRGGLFGFWTWDGAGQHVSYDSVRVWDPAAPEPEICEQAVILPGDCTLDGQTDISDVVCYVALQFPGFYLLGGRPPTPCLSDDLSDPDNIAVLDINGDGVIDISEIIYLANYLFMGGPPPVQGEACVAIAVATCENSVGCE